MSIVTDRYGNPVTDRYGNPVTSGGDVPDQPSDSALERERAAQEAAAAKAELQKSGDFDKATTGTPILYRNGKAGTETDLQRFKEGKGYAVYDSVTDADGNQYVAVSGKNSSFIEKISPDGTVERIDNVSSKKGKKRSNVNRVLGAFEDLKSTLDLSQPKPEVDDDVADPVDPTPDPTPDPIPDPIPDLPRLDVGDVVGGPALPPVFQPEPDPDPDPDPMKPADPSAPGPTGPQAGGDFIPTVPATEVLELEADEVAPINPSVPQTVVQKVAPVTYQSDPSSGPAPVTPGATTQTPATGTFSTPIQTAGLSAVPQQVTYKTHYAGTAGAVPQTLVTTAPGSGEQYTSGYRTAYYVNDLGQRIPISEFNGRPTTYVPPGFYREGSKKAGTDVTGTTIPTYGSQGDPNVQVQLPNNPVQMSEGGDVTLAKKFLGFDGPPQQLDNFLQANPAAAARMGKYRQAMTNMGGMRMGAQAGTVVTDNPTVGTEVTGETQAVVNPMAQMSANLVGQTMQPIQAPTGMIQPTAGEFIPVDAGMATPISPMAEAATVGEVVQAEMPTTMGTATADVTAVSPGVQAETDKLTAAQGEVSNIITAAQQETSSVSGLEAAQGEAIKVNAPDAREIQEGELVSGAADATKAAAFTEQIQAAEATPSKQATVAGQLEGLMKQFEGGNTPPWAAGSMRQAMAKLAARGLGASSMAGQAVIQAAMEAALPIAQMDAQTQASFESQNLSNRQQRAMLAAEQRAKFIGQEFDQEFQSRVINASKISDIANMNFTAEQQIALEDARAANTMELANLSNSQAMVMAEAAALAQLDMANLSNRQQTAVQNAQNFLQMDLANLSNKQQTEMFKSQQNIQALFTDAAAENATAQFNAANENQVNQFFASLSNQTSQFNATQQNAMNQFNVNSVNALREFNSGLQQQRDLFNAQNGLVIAQANAQWRQNVATINNATQNESNMAFAQTINALTSTNLDAIWQRERDILSMAFQVSEGNADRANSIILQKMAGDNNIDVAELQAKIGAAQSKGNFFAEMFKTIIPLPGLN
jgi:hypothetical protein